MKPTRKSKLDLLRNLQYDKSNMFDSQLSICGSHGNMKNILEVICIETMEFNLRLDFGLYKDVRDWLTKCNTAILHI